MNPLIYIDKNISYQTRRNLGRKLFILSFLFLSCAVTALILELPPLYAITFEIFFILSLCLFIANSFIKYFYLIIYRDGVKQRFGKSHEVEIIRDYVRNHKDPVRGYLHSPYGFSIMKRLGIKKQNLEHYIQSRNNTEYKENPFGEDEYIDLERWTAMLYEDAHFREFLVAHHITLHDLRYGAKLIENIAVHRSDIDAFWSRNKLSRISPFEEEVFLHEQKNNIFVTAQVINALKDFQKERAFIVLSELPSHVKSYIYHPKEKLSLHVSDLRHYLDSYK